MNIKLLNKTKEIIKLKLEKNKSILHIINDFNIIEEEINVKKHSYLVHSNLSYSKRDSNDDINFYYLNDEDGGIITLSLIDIISGILSNKIEIVYIHSLKKDIEIDNFIKRLK